MIRLSRSYFIHYFSSEDTIFYHSRIQKLIFSSSKYKKKKRTSFTQVKYFYKLSLKISTIIVNYKQENDRKKKKKTKTGLNNKLL